jgi:hypothetical protein
MAVPADYEAANGGFTQNIEKWIKSYPFRKYEIPKRKQPKNLQVVIFILNPAKAIFWVAQKQNLP